MTETVCDVVSVPPLRQRMEDQLRIAGLAKSTGKSYIREIKNLANYYDASPDELDAEQVREWYLGKIDQGLGPATTNVSFAALNFLYIDTLGWPGHVAGLRSRKKPGKLPRYMEEKEVEHLIMATPDLRYRTAFVTAYGAGLRVSETVAIKVGDILSEKKLLHIHSGKGGTERMAPLPDAVIHYLRVYWSNIWPKPQSWLFYGASPDAPISTASLQQAFRTARDKAGIDGRHSFHSLRHSAATHLHERGTDMEVIREVLGHRSANTTRHYARATGKMFETLDHPVSGFSMLRI